MAKLKLKSWLDSNEKLKHATYFKWPKLRFTFQFLTGRGLQEPTFIHPTDFFYYCIFIWIFVSNHLPDFLKDVSFHVSLHVKFDYEGCCDFIINNTCLVTWLLPWNITFWVKYSVKIGWLFYHHLYLLFSHTNKSKIFQNRFW